MFFKRVLLAERQKIQKFANIGFFVDFFVMPVRQATGPKALLKWLFSTFSRIDFGIFEETLRSFRDGRLSNNEKAKKK